MLKKQDALVPLFGGVCFFLSAIEFIIPKPLPFFRIGLANVPLLLALDIVSFPAFFLLAVIKIIGQAVINGTLFSYVLLFSTAGTLSAAIIMYSLHKVPKKLLSLAGISAAGAFVSNLVQLLIGRFFIFGEGIIYIAPVLFCVGIITGAVLGMFCEKFISESAWYNQLLHESVGELKLSVPEQKKSVSYPFFRLGFGLSLLMMLFLVPFLFARVVILGAGLILCIMEKQKIHWLPLLISSIGIIFCHLLLPSGKELVSLGSLPLVTSGALLNGIDKAVIAAAMIYISRWTMQIPLRLPGKIGTALSEALYIFNQLFEYKNTIKPQALISSLDEVLLSLPFIMREPAKPPTA